MSVKRTIAIVGATDKTGTEFANQFADFNGRLLLISHDIHQLTELLNNISGKSPKAEIDSIECVKDGCWEADIIILATQPHEQKMVAEMMKEVATQKIVVSISNEENAGKELQELLPYSKLVRISDILPSRTISIEGSDQEANEEVSAIFFQAGYHPAIMQGLHDIL